MTLFPEMFAPLQTSLLGKAQEKNLIEINLVNIRDFSTDKHKKCDDSPYGGGAGMLMTPQPLYDAIQACQRESEKPYVIYLSPKGKVLNQTMVKELAEKPNLTLICGHYEGIDQRIVDLCVNEMISVGDYVLTGGELPAMILVDAMARLQPSVLHDSSSVLEESHECGLLEYPQYTKPREFMGLEVPEILVNGHHAKIKKWQNEQAIEETKKHRPDLYEKWKEKQS